MVSSISSSIANTLGIGSGIDTAKLVEDLANATKAPRLASIQSREQANTARISALGSLSGAIDSFSASLATLIDGGTLFTQPTSSNSALVTASALPGYRLGNLSAQVEVTRLATAQTLTSGYQASSSAAIGQGALTLTTASGTFNVTIDSSNATLSGLARAINAAGAGVTASTVTDSNGARLVIKGATGAASAFTIAADAALADFAYDPNVSGGMTRAQQALDALVKVDGVEITRATNSIADVIEGVRLELVGASVGTVVSIGTKRPTEAIATAMTDFVAAYNQLLTLLNDAANPKTGPLRNDPGVRDMQRQIGRLSSTVLASGSGNAPRSLAEIGVRTNRDGTLTLDSDRLDSILASDPEGVEALFNPTQTSSSDLVRILNPMGKVAAGTYTLTNLVAGNPASGTIAGVAATANETLLVAAAGSAAAGLIIEPLGNVASATVTIELGLGGALKAIRDSLQATTGPLTVSQKRLTIEQETIADEREAMEARDTVYRAQLERQFTAMQSRLAAYASTQNFLDQQVKIWTNGDN